MPIYLNAERLEIETRLAQAYSGQADNLLDEVEALLGAQTWPNDSLFEGPKARLILDAMEVGRLDKFLETTIAKRRQPDEPDDPQSRV